MGSADQTPLDVVGLVPAAGEAKRLEKLPCSKELFPVGFHRDGDGGQLNPKVVSQYLLEKMRLAGAQKAYIVIRDGKWDIPSFFGDGHRLDMHLAYLMMRLPFGVPYTLDQAYPFLRESMVLLGFPDILFQPDDAYVSLLEKQKLTEADIVLGLFPSEQPHKMDMVDRDDAGRVKSIAIKPTETQLKYTWMIAVWTPAFTRFMHDFVTALGQSTTVARGTAEEREYFVGDVVQAAIDRGMSVETVVFPDSKCVDIGTPEDLLSAVRESVRLAAISGTNGD